MTAAEGTARFQAVEQVREALDCVARGTDMCKWCGSEARQLGEPHDPSCPIVALDVLEEIAEAAAFALPSIPPAFRAHQMLKAALDRPAALAAVRSGRVA